MLIGMQKAASDRVREDKGPPYVTKVDHFFSHERLDVYQYSAGICDLD